MRKHLLSIAPILLSLAAFAFPAANMAAPPPNDSLANATVITTLPFAETVDTSEATGGDPTIFGCSRDHRTIWYEFTPTAPARIVAETTGTAINLMIEGLYGVVCNISLLGDGSSFNPRIAYNLEPGVTYIIQVDGNIGPTEFGLEVAPPPPAHDDFDQATAIGELPFTDTVNTVSATRTFDDPDPCNPGFTIQQGTVWYEFTPPEDIFILARSRGSDYVTEIAVLTGSRGALTSLGCDFFSVRAQLTGGVTYYIMVQSSCIFGGCSPGGTLSLSLEGGQAPQQAVRVFGQPGFTTAIPNFGGRSASSLNRPRDVAVDASGEHLYVVDSGNHRVLQYEDPLAGDAVADRVLGQPDFFTGTANTGGIGADTLSSPLYIDLDTSGNLYVADALNNRVLRYDDPLRSATAGERADIVIGQPDFYSAAAGVGDRNLNIPEGIVVDAAENLLVGEFNNSRVVRFDGPLATNAAASLVLGQPDFFSNFCNFGGVNASSLCVVFDITLDQTGNFYVSDGGNRRLLKFSPPLFSGQSADLVIGQPDFATGFDPEVNQCGGPDVSASTVCDVRGLAVDCAGNLYLSDSSNNRILIYKDPLTTDTVADKVLGQLNFRTSLCNAPGLGADSLCSPRGLTLDAAANLYVADGNNHRVLMFEAGPELFETDADDDGVVRPSERCPCEAPALGLDADLDGCSDTLDELRSIVQGLSLEKQVANGLLGKLREAQKALDRGEEQIAILKLQDFIDQVEGQRGKGISESDADLLVAYAHNLITLISA